MNTPLVDNYFNSSTVAVEDRHFMVDVETFGVRPGSAIVSIGAVQFNPIERFDAQKIPIHLKEENQFYVEINNLDSSNRGFTADPDTMRWWKKQSIWPQLSQSIMNSDVTVPMAAKNFAHFLRKGSSSVNVKLWANSPSFDISILRAMFKNVGEEFPIEYNQEMDYRTIMELNFPYREDRPARPSYLDHLPLHHALGDATAQASHLIAACNKMNLLTARQAAVSRGQKNIDSNIQAQDGPVGRHLMLEIKTLGKAKGSSLLSIAAVLFDPNGNKPLHVEPDNQFYLVLSSFDMGNYGFSSDADTVRWWKSQPIWPKLSRDTIQSGVSLVRAIKLLNEFIDRKAPTKVWANSPSFDIEILREAYQTVRLPFPIFYRQEMDFRTVMDMVYPNRDMRPKIEIEGFQPHHALGDAMAQSKLLISTMQHLNLDRQALAEPRQDDPPKIDLESAKKRRSAKPK